MSGALRRLKYSMWASGIGFGEDLKSKRAEVSWEYKLSKTTLPTSLTISGHRMKFRGQSDI